MRYEHKSQESNENADINEIPIRITIGGGTPTRGLCDGLHGRTLPQQFLSKIRQNSENMPLIKFDNLTHHKDEKAHTGYHANGSPNNITGKKRTVAGAKEVANHRIWHDGGDWMIR